MTDKKNKLESTLSKLGLDDSEAAALLMQLQQTPKPQAIKPYHLGGKKHKFLIISDSHMGHKCYDPRIMDAAAKVSKDCDFVFHGGDIVEGHYEGKRHGHVFELTHIGADNQVAYAASELSKLKAPLFFIEGNHAGNTFYKLCGYDIGKRLESLVAGSKYLGQQHGILEFAKGIKLQGIHPDGGSSYAISYKPQKIIESLEGGTKPDILSIAHFHKAEYLYYRNIHAIQNGCLERQTGFMKNLGLAAHCGFWEVSLEINYRGISSITPKYYPMY